MSKGGLVASAVGRCPRVCHNLIRGRLIHSMHTASYSTRAREAFTLRSNFTRPAAVTAGTILGAGTLVFAPGNPQEEISHIYAAFERTGRVLKTLVACMIEYELLRLSAAARWLISNLATERL